MWKRFWNKTVDALATGIVVAVVGVSLIAAGTAFAVSGGVLFSEYRKGNVSFG